MALRSVSIISVFSGKPSRRTLRSLSLDLQALYLRYPTATPLDAYIAKAVKIESGAKSALDPNSVRSIGPYLQEDVPDIDLTVGNVTVVDVERTFWDKIVILHGQRRWFDICGELKGSGQRV
ncbi:nucleotidyl transferase AbiEii/AbiGii toxin family protein [Phaeobacter sp. C3_T13_0]|uniref:nucleotidyl transferase AbiEii/AbiGii toxin family protein n=1 Tax=Phaeobacter cretensis TaxID=3342641 RepID=UPI0039BC46DF